MQSTDYKTVPTLYFPVTVRITCSGIIFDFCLSLTRRLAPWRQGLSYLSVCPMFADMHKSCRASITHCFILKLWFPEHLSIPRPHPFICTTTGSAIAALWAKTFQHCWEVCVSSQADCYEGNGPRWTHQSWFVVNSFQLSWADSCTWASASVIPPYTRFPLDFGCPFESSEQEPL